MRKNRDAGCTEQFRAMPASSPCSTTFSLRTGSAPGSPMQTGQICVFGSPPVSVEQPQKILVSVLSWM